MIAGDLPPAAIQQENESEVVIMAQKVVNDYMTIRLHGDLKEDFDEFCMNCGTTVSAAVNLFASKTVKEGEIPFEVTAYDIEGYHEGGEKQLSRTNIRLDKETRQAFAAVCARLGVPAGRVVKMFMVNCIMNGKFPF